MRMGLHGKRSARFSPCVSVTILPCVTLFAGDAFDKTMGTTTRIGFIHRGQHHAAWTHFLPGFIAFLSDRRRVNLRITSFQEPSHVVRPKRGCCHLEAGSVFYAACRNLSRAQY